MEASDLHVVAGYPPVLRVHGELRQLECAAIDGDAVPGLLVPLCPPHAMARFQAERNADFALELALHGQAAAAARELFHERTADGGLFSLDSRRSFPTSSGPAFPRGSPDSSPTFATGWCSSAAWSARAKRPPWRC